MLNFKFSNLLHSPSKLLCLYVTPQVLEGKLANEICPDACVAVGAPERPAYLAGHAIVMTIKLAELQFERQL